MPLRSVYIALAVHACAVRSLHIELSDKRNDIKDTYHQYEDDIEGCQAYIYPSVY